MLQASLIKPLIVALALLAIVAGGQFLYIRATKAESAALSRQVDQLSGDLRGLQELRKQERATLASLRQEKAALGRAAASARQSLRAALASTPDWADQPVPKEVQNALAQP